MSPYVVVKQRLYLNEYSKTSLIRTQHPLERQIDLQGVQNIYSASISGATYIEAI